MIYAIYFIAGILFKAFIDGAIQTHKLLKLKKENEQKFKQVLRRIKKDKSTFKTRINNTVYIKTTLNETDNVDVILFLDTKKVAIFKNDVCLHTSDSINEELRKELVKEIEEKYTKEIEDTVELLGNKMNLLNDFPVIPEVNDALIVSRSLIKTVKIWNINDRKFSYERDLVNKLGVEFGSNKIIRKNDKVFVSGDCFSFCSHSSD